MILRRSRLTPDEVVITATLMLLHFAAINNFTRTTSKYDGGQSTSLSRFVALMLHLFHVLINISY